MALLDINGLTDTKANAMVSKKYLIKPFAFKERHSGCNHQKVSNYSFHYRNMDKSYCSEYCWAKTERKGE